MFHSQQQEQLQQSSFTYLPQSSNDNPNSLCSYPQPQPQQEPPLFPPGTDPYAHPTHYAYTHVQYEAQTQFYVDPNAVSQSWITPQVNPIGYDATSSVVALNSSGNNNWMNQPQPLVNDVIGSTSNQTKLNQTVRCEVCNIVCNTKDVYEKHVLGKKHLKNLQVKTNPAAAIFPNTSNATNNVSIVGQTGNGDGQMMLGSSGLVNGQELERKKQKLLNSGAAVDSVQMCTICNVACNSYEAFSKHLSGRRHAAQAGLIAIDGIGPYIAAVRANDHFWNKGKKTTKPKINQCTWCEVCNINCNCNDAYAKHLSGKKHLKNLENLEKSKNGTSLVDTQAATNQITGPVENPGANDSSGVNVQRSEKRAAQSEATKEDLEAKKRKVMQGGAAAAAVRVCTICNVVCNSQKVFKYHLTGQKHAAMVKK